MSENATIDWKPDEDFLEFFLKDTTRFFADKTGKETSRQTTEEHIKSIVDQMKQGTPFGRAVYEVWYNDQATLERYVAYTFLKKDDTEQSKGFLKNTGL
ncbi:hypothetical protein HY484_00930 [Candidatus Woesearchaeota archaeon]|nr:hypothetical protein [Candidatus Woesearchaeota archaeon]